jgi:hypothetical protein
MTGIAETSLLIALQAAVPLRIMDLRALPPGARANQIRLWAADASDVIAFRGDVLRYGSGEAAAAFNWLARGLPPPPSLPAVSPPWVRTGAPIMARVSRLR